MDKEKVFDHKLRNLIHTAALITGMGALMALLGYLMLGTIGIYWALALAIGILIFGQASPKLVLRAHQASVLSTYQAPTVYNMVRELSQKAGLDQMPKLYYVPSRKLNAFALGNKNDAYIGITSGLLNVLDTNELAGVLAHEISHIKNNDMQVMGIARLFHQITNNFATVGKIMLVLSLPLLLFGYTPFSFLAILLMIFAPSISCLMQLALSRTREFEADLDAARLTGNPNDLASALQKLDYYSTNLFTRMLGQGSVVAALSTHPSTAERVKRLMGLTKERHFYTREGFYEPRIRVIYPTMTVG